MIEFQRVEVAIVDDMERYRQHSKKTSSVSQYNLITIDKLLFTFNSV